MIAIAVTVGLAKWIIDDSCLIISFWFFFRNKYQEPSLDEGFSEIVRVNFVPRFRSSEEETLYRSYLLEKWT